MARLGIVSRADWLAESSRASHGYLVDRLIPSRGITLIGGPPGQGKTTLAAVITAAIASENANFGGRETQHGSVLWVCEDRGTDGQGDTSDTLVKAERGLGVPHSDRIMRVQSGFRAFDPEAVESVCDLVRDHNVSVVIIDCLRRVMAGNDAMSEITDETMRAISQISDAGCAVIAIHHTTKDGRKLRGSDDFLAAAKVSYLVTMAKDKASLSVQTLCTHGEPEARLDLSVCFSDHDLVMSPIRGDAELCREIQSLVSEGLSIRAIKDELRDLGFTGGSKKIESLIKAAKKEMANANDD